MRGTVDLESYKSFSGVVGDLGRFVVPKEVRDVLGIKPGTPIEGYLRVIK